MIISVPMFRQAPIAMIDGMAQNGSLSQSGPLMPTQLSTVFMRPESWRMNRQTTATATIEVTTGV